jgi:hypothetical protein
MLRNRYNTNSETSDLLETSKVGPRPQQYPNAYVFFVEEKKGEMFMCCMSWERKLSFSSKTAEKWKKLKECKKEKYYQMAEDYKYFNTRFKEDDMA